MIRDVSLRIVFIPLLGVFLPVLAGIIHYSLYSPVELIGANFLFILISFCIWAGCNWIHSRLRYWSALPYNPVSKMLAVVAISMIYGAVVGGLTSWAWIYFSREQKTAQPVYQFVAVCVVAVIVFTLIYEILFLNKEREMDNKTVDRLDQERSQAELKALSNEMDPHFIFNSLNTLNHLILNNPLQAHTYNNKLAQVYKYFLINKRRELIPIKNEMEFIDDYFFLLQLRHDNKLQFETRLGNTPTLIPPCSLQLLVENAIKHNDFSEEFPLHIAIESNGEHLKVTNNIRPKPYLTSSTHIGLKNLSSRYKLLCNKDIIVEKNRERFVVKLPFIVP